MLKGCYTALVTPFKGDGVDYDGLDRLCEFQVQNGITGILAVGTTGESPTLSWDEHIKVIEKVREKTKGRARCIAGTGSNNTKEAIDATGHAADVGVDAVLLVDPYYNGPSSLEIRKEYVGPVAAAFPKLEIIPYVIPGRSGTQLLPEDLALLSQARPNVNTVKEATGNPDNMKRTRTCCGPDFTILSGDDGMTFQMMTTPEIGGAGVISVASNVIPKAVTEMVNLLDRGERAAAEKLLSEIEPLFGLVTVKTVEKTPFGEVECKAKNPMAIKGLMAILGMPTGGCRRPLGKLTRNALDKILAAAKKVQAANPDIFAPVAAFFNVDIEERLNNPEYQKGLIYEEY